MLSEDRTLLVPLDSKVSAIRRSNAYRTAEWFEAVDLRWYICQAKIDPVEQEIWC